MYCLSLIIITPTINALQSSFKKIITAQKKREKRHVLKRKDEGRER